MHLQDDNYARGLLSLILIMASLRALIGCWKKRGLCSIGKFSKTRTFIMAK